MGALQFGKAYRNPPAKGLEASDMLALILMLSRPMPNLVTVTSLNTWWYYIAGYTYICIYCREGDGLCYCTRRGHFSSWRDAKDKPHVCASNVSAVTCTSYSQKHLFKFMGTRWVLSIKRMHLLSFDPKP